MLDAFEATRRWKEIKSYTDKISDPVLKESIMAEYKARAIKEWGFCPDNTNYKPAQIELDDWEQDFLKRIKTSKEYGIFVKDEQVEKEAKIRMRNFIEKGGKYEELPDDLKNKHTLKLYFETLLEEIQNCEDFLKKDIYKE